MRDNRKKIVSLTVAAACLASAFAFTACGEKAWSLDEKLSYTSSTAAATSNGGFAVEKDGFVYYINGSAAYDGNNTFGEVEKGALMRISTENLRNSNYTQTETVVPLLFAAQNYDSGIYIFGDYVYFATPTTDKDLDGNVLSDSLDFKRAKLDGSETMSTPYFRLDNNAKQYRFVQLEENGPVYCLYVDGTMLKSFNTATGDETVLVSDSSATYYFDKTDATNPTVYYTMGVKKLIDTDSAASEEYNQLYRVRVDATATVNADEASYTVKGNGYEKTYDFDKEFLQEKNAEAKDDKNDAPYDFDDYTTYPYVNLGELVLDGIGASSELKMTQFSDKADYDEAVSLGTLTELKGYTYAVQSVENGGVYFTRSKVMKGANELSALYYVGEEALGAAWNSVGANHKLDVSCIVSLDTANASASALYTIENGTHTYYYVSGTVLYKATAPTVASGVYTESDPLEMARVASGAVLMTMEGDNLYYRDGSNYLYSIDYTGEADDYHQLASDRIEPVQIAAVELNTNWYGFEVFENTVLYNNAQTVNSQAYNYVYAAKLGDAEALATRMENYTTVSDYFTNLSDSDLTSLFRYYFRTNGKTKAYDAVKDLYDDYEQKEFTAFSTRAVSANKSKTDYTEMFKDEDGVYYDSESYFVNMLGAYTADDEEMVENGFAATLKKETAAEDEKNGLAWWAILLICVGGVLVAGGASAIIIWQVQKAKKAKRDREATAIRPKKKIDTTDDKSIDVYANDEEKAEETPAETAEEQVETVEETAETQTTEE